jgi:hypothetical protein
VVPRSDARYPRRGRRARGGSPLASPEALERRELLAFSPLGFSLPDLTLTAFSAPVASWGQQIAITADVFNQGASTIPEPFNQVPNGQPNAFASIPGSAAGPPGTSHADAPASVIDIFASTRPGKGPLVQVGVLDTPAIPQNNFAVVSGNITLPARPAGFPAVGKVYFTYVINGDNAFPESGVANNAFKSHQPVVLAPALPNLQVATFDVPSPLVPGETFTPTIQIANLGTAPTDQQGPVTVDLVASTDKNFGPGDQILATFTVQNIPPLSAVSTLVPQDDALNVQTPSNVVTLDTTPVTLPSTPDVFFLGVKIDPGATLKQQGLHVPAQFDAVAKVGPPIPGLLPLTPLTSTGTTTTIIQEFPFPLPGSSSPGGVDTTTGTTTVTAAAKKKS